MSRSPDKRQQPKRPDKQPPVPGLIIFKANGSNFREAKVALTNHCLATYGEVSNFLSTGAAIVRAAPTAEEIAVNYAGFGAGDRGKILLSLMGDYRAQIKSDADASVKMFGLFLQLNEDDGVERIKSHADWAAAAAAISAFLLWRIMSAVHTTHISNITAGEALYNAMSRFNRCSQSSDMSLAVYRESIAACAAVLESLHHPNVPDAAAQARHMVHGLDKLRYGEYIADVLNNERRPGAPFPQTMQEVVDGARAFIPTATVQQAQANVLAFNARVSTQKPKGEGCHICGSKEHWKKDCPRGKKKLEATVGSATPPAAAAAAANTTPADGSEEKRKRKNKRQPKKAYATSISTEAASANDVCLGPSTRCILCVD